MRSHLDRLHHGEASQNLLKAREDDVLKLIAEGVSSQSIAETLTISFKTVEHHKSNILQELGVRDRTELTRCATRAGLIEP
jgi:DNA-binding NarL/FixJ family response regulator